MKEYVVVYEQAEDGGWGAHSPDVEGVFALGASREDVEQWMAEALTAHLEHLRDRGQPIPEPRTTPAGSLPKARRRRRPPERIET
jgi:predicted RNase H-like HicB family nuclease